MRSRFVHISFALLVLIQLLFISCRNDEPNGPSDHSGGTNEKVGTAVYWTDSTEWRVHVFASGVLYGSGYSVDSPYHIPTKDEAYTLKTITYGPSGKRYVTCDGYTFGMPSASVTKAGSKTKYNVLGLWQRATVITINF